MSSALSGQDFLISVNTTHPVCLLPWVMLGLWSIFLLGGFFAGTLDYRRERRMPAWTRMCSSAALVAAAWIWFPCSPGDTARTYALLIAVGVTSGFLGDLILGDIITMRRPLAVGFITFGLGHLAYSFAMITLGNDLGWIEMNRLIMAGIIWAAICVLGWYFLLMHRRPRRALRWIALPYAMLLSSVATFATLLAQNSLLFLPLVAGCALFIASDLLVALRRINRQHFFLIDDIVWLTYGPAQMLIVTSSIAARHVYGA